MNDMGFASASDVESKDLEVKGESESPAPKRIAPNKLERPGVFDLRSSRNTMVREQEKELDSLSTKIRQAVAKVAEVMGNAEDYELSGDDEFILCAERLEAALLWLNAEPSLKTKVDNGGQPKLNSQNQADKYRCWAELVDISLENSKQDSLVMKFPSSAFGPKVSFNIRVVAHGSAGVSACLASFS